MAQIKIPTNHGTAFISKRGKHDHYYIKLIDRTISDKERTIRRTLKHVPTDCYKDYIIEEIENILNQIRNKKPEQQSNPVRFIKEVYFPYMDKMCEVGAKLPTKGNWTKVKTKNDKYVIEKYLIPWINENNLGWKDLIDDRTNELFVDYQRTKSGIEDTTIAKHKGLFNLMFRLAKQYKLIDGLPTYPKLENNTKMRYGMKVRAIARATDDMIAELYQYAKDHISIPYRGKNEERDWHRKVLYNWIVLIIDTGIRPFPNIPFLFEAIENDADGIKFYRNEKIGTEYVARGGPLSKKAVTELKTMYIRQGFKPVHVLSDIHGDKHPTMNRHTREILEKVGWKEMRDKGGRKYEPHSIRKWHINHAIELGERREDIANRVGHSVATLINEYEDKSHTGSTRPSNFDSVLEPIEKVSYLA